METRYSLATGRVRVLRNTAGMVMLRLMKYLPNGKLWHVVRSTDGKSEKWGTERLLQETRPFWLDPGIRIRDAHAEKDAYGEDVWTEIKSILPQPDGEVWFNGTAMRLGQNTANLRTWSEEFGKPIKGASEVWTRLV